MHEWVPIIAAVIGGLSSAPLWTFLVRRLGFGQSELSRLRRVERQLEAQIDELKARLAVIEHHHASHFARWILDAGKRFCWVNDKAVLTIFAPLGHSREWVLGKSFHDVVEPSVAAEIERLDQVALSNPGGAVSCLVKLHPDLPLMFIVKIAGTGREGELVYEGLAFRTNDPDVAHGLGVTRTYEARIAAVDRLSENK